MLEKLHVLLGHQGIRLLSKIILVLLGISLIYPNAPYLGDFLQWKLLNLNLLTGQNILGVLAFLVFWLIHRNHI